MKKLILAFATAGVLSLGALATTSSDAEARGRGGHAGFSKSGGHMGGAKHFGGTRHFGGHRPHQGHRAHQGHWGHKWGHNKWGHNNWGHRPHNYRPYAYAYRSYGYKSYTPSVSPVASTCWQNKWNGYAYAWVNVCPAPVYTPPVYTPAVYSAPSYGVNYGHRPHYGHWGKQHRPHHGHWGKQHRPHFGSHGGHRPHVAFGGHRGGHRR